MQANTEAEKQFIVTPTPEKPAKYELKTSEGSGSIAFSSMGELLTFLEHELVKYEDDL